MVTVVHSNIIGNSRALVNACEKIVPLKDSSLIAALTEVPDSEETLLNVKIAEVLKRVWADAGAQETWVRRAEFHIQDALSWYMNEIDRIAAQGYVPSIDDILRARVRTSGIVEESYKIDGVEFVMYDVGGQRNERKKWIHCFDAVTAIIFVAAISEYDQYVVGVNISVNEYS